MILSADELYFLDGQVNRNMCSCCSYQKTQISKSKNYQDLIFNKKKIPFRLEKIESSNDKALLRMYELFLFRHRINPDFFCKYKTALWLVEITQHQTINVSLTNSCIHLLLTVHQHIYQHNLQSMETIWFMHSLLQTRFQEKGSTVSF